MSDDKRTARDPELAAMERISRTLANLEADARGRVMAWVISRQAADEAARAQARERDWTRQLAKGSRPADSEGGEA